LANRPSSTDPAPAGQDPKEKHATDSPPGLGEQFGRTRSALVGLVGAHLRLAKAEIGEIAGELKRAAILGGIALGLLFVAGMLASIGTILWFDQWLFGSLGWGALHGTEILLAIAVTLVLLIMPASAGRIGLAVFVGLIAGAAVGALLGLNLTNQGWGWIADHFFSGLTWPPDGHPMAVVDRPIATAVIVLAEAAGVVGLVIALLFGRGVLGRIGRAIAVGIVCAIFGGLLGALTGVRMSWNVSVAVGLAIFLVVWPALAAVLVVTHMDTKALKQRFMPEQTIETTKETIEWVREQLPLVRKP
jgi:uncharacterized membrane protein YqjE